MGNKLPCPTNLKKWKKLDVDDCMFCNKLGDIYHPIVECEFAKTTWQIVEHALCINLDHCNIILGTNMSDDINFVLTCYSYILYKYWLLEHNKKLKRSRAGFNIFLDTELRSVVATYSYIKKRKDIVLIMNKVLASMRTMLN